MLAVLSSRSSSAEVKKISNSSYCYAIDHLGSVREVTDSSGVVQSRYDNSLYSQKTKLAGALDSDFQYAGCYMNAPSGFNLTVYMVYNPLQGRWISRDPINEQGGLNDCFELVNTEGHFEYGRKPDWSPDAHCFNTLTEAKKDGERCKCPVIFAKKRIRAQGRSTSTRGQSPNNSIRVEHVD